MAQTGFPDTGTSAWDSTATDGTGAGSPETALADSAEKAVSSHAPTIPIGVRHAPDIAIPAPYGYVTWQPDAEP